MNRSKAIETPVRENEVTMKVAIQMLTIATTVSCILLIVFAVTIVYSMKDIRVDWGEPEVTVTADGKLLFEPPIG